MRKKIIKFIAKLFKIDIYFERPYTLKVVQSELTPLNIFSEADIDFRNNSHQYEKLVKEENERTIFNKLVGRGLVKHRIDERYDGFNRRLRSELTLYTTVCECTKSRHNSSEMQWCEKCNGKVD